MSRVNYRFQDKFDLPTFLIATALTFLGLLAIYSATRSTVAEHSNYIKQAISWGVAFVIFVVVVALPIRWLRVVAWPSYALTLIGLVLVLFIGKVTGGQKCWIHLGPLSVQPSEFAKFSTVLVLATFLSRHQTDIDNMKDISVTLLLGMLPVGLIMLEPDLGSSFVFFGILLAMLYWRGVSSFGLFFVLSPGVVAISALFGTTYLIIVLVLSAVLLIFFRKDIFLSGSIFAVNLSAGFFVDNVYNILSPHQKKRIATFVDPDSDPLGAGYNSLQARIAIGSGGFWGKGFLSGNQTQLHFIPAQWTDFIFCVIGEEFGFIGSSVVVVLYIVMFIRILKVALMVKDEFYSLVIIGILSIYVGHFIINLGMAIGLLPVIGIPLPFVSYGGTSLILNMLMLAVVLNIYRSLRDFS
ncbi:MAG: rod shape-determining protein RodA [Ignavibacteria bacterium]|nr:rod shape-determining protein RodA [Ignavibacteria bacterium]